MKRILTKRRLAGACSVAVILAVAVGAFAYWTTTGNGTGSASTGTSTAWAVTSDAATGGALTPGGPIDTIVVHVTNPGSGVQHLSTVTAAVATSNGSEWTTVPDYPDKPTISEPARTSH